jgi:hypothetical protein
MAAARLEGTSVSAINGVVAHFLDGRVLKGTTRDFSPGRPAFHLHPQQGTPCQVRMSQLKAVFFVKDLAGDPTRVDLLGFIKAPAETIHGKKIAVQFSDGELLCGYSLSYSPRRDGFFMFPADPGSNNLRVFVAAGEAQIAGGAEAEELAQRVLDSRAA